MKVLNITPERRREINTILKENERKYKNGEIKSIPLSEFLEKLKRKREELDKLMERETEDES